jgi:hypothetical protein
VSRVQEAYAIVFAKSKTMKGGWSNWFIYNEEEIEEVVNAYHKTHDVEIYVRLEIAR